MRHVFVGQIQLKLLLQPLHERVERLRRIVGRDQFPDQGDQTLDLHAVAQATYGEGGLLVFNLGQLVGMKQEAMINQQAKAQAAA